MFGTIVHRVSSYLEFSSACVKNIKITMLNFLKVYFSSGPGKAKVLVVYRRLYIRSCLLPWTRTTVDNSSCQCLRYRLLGQGALYSHLPPRHGRGGIFRRLRSSDTGFNNRLWNSYLRLTRQIYPICPG